MCKIKLLWIGNGPINKVCQLDRILSNGDIGWISSIIDCLLVNDSVQIIYVFPQSVSKDILQGEEGLFRYYGIYQGEKRPWKRNPCFGIQLEKILRREEPDLVHIWGTEYAHSLDAYDTLEKLDMANQTVIHIQGLISVYAEQYFAGVPQNICRQFSFRDFVRHSNIVCEQRKYYKRGRNEKELLQRAKCVMGRTDWDYAHVRNINNQLMYYKCNESMRSCFFDYQWAYSKCEKHTIFVTQGNYPIKGFHYLVKAIGVLSKKMSNVKVYVAGEKIIFEGSEVIRQSTYARYVKRLMRENGVEELFQFLGHKNENEMAQLYQLANVFVLPSAIENSPNSLAEALVVGTPCIAAHVGGVTSMVEHRRDCFVYQHNDPIVLAEYLYRVLSNPELATEMSKMAREYARKNYSAENNCINLFEIYKSILSR